MMTDPVAMPLIVAILLVGVWTAGRMMVAAMQGKREQMPAYVLALAINFATLIVLLVAMRHA